MWSSRNHPGLRRLAEFPRNEEGGVLVFVCVALVAIVGMAAITFDLGRAAATQTDLQAYADHVALAAAGELDGKLDSITRAQTAAEFLIRDRQTFADGNQALGSVGDYSLRFLTSLPANDLDDVTPFVTTNPVQAAFVEVTATPRTVFLPFGRALAALMGEAAPNETVGAVAIAGATEWACDVAPLMFCLPEDFVLSDYLGAAVRLRSGGRGTAWGPGDFGFLDPSDFGADPNGPCGGLNGSKFMACLIAASGNRTRCVAQNGVDIEPGQKVGIENAVFNTRFDMFNGIMSGERNNPHYAPGPHVVTGLANASGGGAACLSTNTEATPDTMPFPVDDCFSDGTCSRFGDANWTEGRKMYVDRNYNDNNGDSVGDTDLFETATTRWEYYNAEIAAAAGGNILTGRAESGRPRCNTKLPADIDGASRRLFIVAGIDCIGNNIRGAAEDVPVEEFVEVFLLQPVGEGTEVTFIEEGVTKSASNFDLWVEIVGSAGGGAGASEAPTGIFRELVELYR